MKRKVWIYFCLLCILFFTSCAVGRYPLSVAEIVSILFGRSENQTARTVFYSIRLSRTILVMISGGALALAGMVFQTVFHNPLVSPDVLGVGGGCSVGAAAAMLFLGGNMLAVQLSAFGTGIFIVFALLFLAGKIRREPLLTLILLGIIFDALASSVLMGLKVAADPNSKLPAIEFWLMGGFSTATFRQVKVVAPIVLCGSAILYCLRFPIKVLSLGDEEAQTLGISVKAVRVTALVLATALVSTVIAAAGVVAWIGLIAPHMVRLHAGEDIVENFSLSFLCGGAVLLFADILSRTVLPMEIPVSIATSFIGAGFLLFLVCRKGDGNGYPAA